MPRGRAHYRVTLADAVEAHEVAISISGGRRGILSVDNILSALGRPYSGYFRPIDRKGAALLEAIVRNHGFVDGNKRTAVLLLDLMLKRSGFEIVQTTNDMASAELEELVVGLADRKLDFNDARQWLRRRCAPIQTNP